jgi:hypothetical protein
MEGKWMVRKSERRMKVNGKEETKEATKGAMKEETQGRKKIRKEGGEVMGSK